MVKYASKLPYGMSAVQEGVGIDASRMRQERAEKVKRILKREGLPTLLVTGIPPVRYLTGFFWREFQPHYFCPCRLLSTSTLSSAVDQALAYWSGLVTGHCRS